MPLHVVSVDTFSSWPPVNKTMQIGYLGSADRGAKAEHSPGRGRPVIAGGREEVAASDWMNAAEMRRTANQSV